MRSILPLRLSVNLIYADSFTLTGGAASYADYTFMLNGIYDPNITGTGHQPRGFDTYAGLYTQYRVHSASVRVLAANTVADTTSAGPQLFGSFISDTVTGAVSVLDIQEAGYSGGYIKSRYRAIQKAGVSVSTNVCSTGGRYSMLQLQRILYGIAVEPLDCYTAVSANPTYAPVYFTVWTGNLDATASAATVLPCNIRIVFNVEFMVPVYLGSS